MRTNLLSLQSTQSLMDRTQERLSTGKKVNSAIDNPSSYYTAQNLTNRAGDLEALLDSMGQGIQTIKAANEGIESITAFVQQAKAVANTARDTALSTEAESAGVYVPEDGEMVITVGDETLTATIDAGTETGIAELVTKLEGGTAAGTSGGGTAYADLSFTIEPNADETGIIIKAKDGAKLSGSATISNGMGLTLSGKIDTTARDNSLEQYNDILNQINQLASDSSYKGVNLLKEDDLKVIFNEDRSSFLEIEGRDATTEGLGLAAVTDWSTNELVDTTIEEAEGAINTLREMASEFGNYYSIVQTREEFTENLVNVLEEGSDKLVLADMNEESANMLALQTRQQLGINALSLASQAAQSVLQLF